VVAGATDSEAALLLAERIRAAADDSGRDGVTVSIGIATLDAGPANAEVDPIIARADAALYRAKAAGRNRVVAA
jgi:diguanylate cyclase (GGDEF)-like protein